MTNDPRTDWDSLFFPEAALLSWILSYSDLATSSLSYFLSFEPNLFWAISFLKQLFLELCSLGTYSLGQVFSDPLLLWATSSLSYFFELLLPLSYFVVSCVFSELHFLGTQRATSPQNCGSGFIGRHRNAEMSWNVGTGLSSATLKWDLAWDLQQLWTEGEQKRQGGKEGRAGREEKERGRQLT